MPSRRQIAVAVALLGLSLIGMPGHGQWVEVQELLASPLQARANFGQSMALDGDTLVVGAYAEDLAPDIVNGGAAYVFERRDGTWLQQAKLVAADAASGDDFSFRVAIADDTIIVTARWDTHSGLYRAGSAYAFVRSGSTWTQQQKIYPADPQFRGRFGQSVKLADDEALISASKRELEYGSVYAFQRQDGLWTQQQKWFAPDRERYAEFGARLALDGDSLLVSAPEDNVLGLSNSGAAYLYTRQAGSWAHRQKLAASDPAREAWFGRSVALWRPLAVVGAASLRAPERPGAAYVFAEQGSEWVEVQKLTPGDATSGDWFGQSAVVDGRSLLVGARKHDHGGLVDAGAVYMFTLGSGPVALCSDVTVAAGPDCTAEASVDAGSYDPEGDAISLRQEPPGPYSGVTQVELVVEDVFGVEDRCQALVTVEDLSVPRAFCNAPATIADDGVPRQFTATTIDNCGSASASVTGYDCAPPAYTPEWGQPEDEISPCVVAWSADTLTVQETGSAGTLISWTLTATDASGNEGATLCTVQAVPAPIASICGSEAQPYGALPAGRAAFDLEGWAIYSPQSFDDCYAIIARDFMIMPPEGEVTFLAGVSITLGDGFVVAPGCSFTAEIDPDRFW